jgi:hypothetical protein
MSSFAKADKASGESGIEDIILIAGLFGISDEKKLFV